MEDFRWVGWSKTTPRRRKDGYDGHSRDSEVTNGGKAPIMPKQILAAVLLSYIFVKM